MYYRNLLYAVKQMYGRLGRKKALLQSLFIFCLSGIFFYSFYLLYQPSKQQPETVDFSAEVVKTDTRIQNRQEEAIVKQEEAEKRQLQTTVEGKINLNTASKEALMSLPHIGAKKAEEIIRYRSEHPFIVVEELMEIKGIGAKTFAKLADFVTV